VEVAVAELDMGPFLLT